MLKVVKRLLAAAAVVCALLGGAVTSAQTNIYFGACGPSGGNGQVVPLKHAGTGCPTAGSWLVDTLAVGTDGVLCWSTVAGSPGTWVQVGGGGALDDLSDVSITTPTAGQVLRRGSSSWANATLAYSDLSGTPTIPDSGADVGLADSPSSDGDYVLRRASGTNSWAAAGGGGSPGWQACSTPGITSISDSPTIVSSCTLPTGWLADGSQLEFAFDSFVVNPSSRQIMFDVILADSGNTIVSGTGSTAGSYVRTSGTSTQLWGEIGVVSVSIGALFARQTELRQGWGPEYSGIYVEPGPLTNATKLLLRAYTDSGTASVSTVFAKQRISTAD